MVESGRSLTIVSYNIQAGRDSAGRPNLESQAELLASLEPDLVALQEVDRHWPRSRSVDQPATLASRLGMRAFFAPNVLGPWSPGSPAYQYGVAVLWRTGAVQSGGCALPGPADREPRGFAWVRLEVSSTPLLLVSTHLGLDAHERLGQASYLADWIAARPEKALVAGDFNMAPDSAEYQLLASRLRDVSSGLNLHTYPASNPDRQIDYVFATPGVEVESVAAIGTLASDHLPLVTRLRIR